MNIADPKYLQYLRDLPDSYLLDILVENEDADRETIFWVLQERGLDRIQIEREIEALREKPWKRPYFLWTAARWFTIFNTLIVTLFNIVGLHQLLNSDHIFKGPMLFLVVGSIVFGFIVGFKFTTHLYHGSKHHIFCGFPFPVGRVELKTGKEKKSTGPAMNIYMAANALVGVSLTLFPLLLIYYCL